MTRGESGHRQACYTKNIIQIDEAHLYYPPRQMNHKLVNIGPHEYRSFK